MLNYNSHCVLTRNDTRALIGGGGGRGEGDVIYYNYCQLGSFYRVPAELYFTWPVAFESMRLKQIIPDYFLSFF